VEFLRCNGRGVTTDRREFATRLHFTLPIAGSFVWHADRDDVFADPTTLLCTHQGESFRMSHPHGGDQSLVLTPSDHVLTELSEHAEKTGLTNQRRSRIAPARAQLMAYTLCLDPLTASDALAADECLLQFFESIAVSESAPRMRCDDRLVRRALDYVHHTPEPLLTLQNIAAAMGVRAAYLTNAFRERTGQPLYRYIMSLKLVRALHRITTTDQDLTRIALDLGFSSHSHLSAVFRSRYGVSPSQVRKRGAGAMLKRSSSIERVEHAPFAWRALCAARGGTTDDARAEL
jgi:AraC-like DNA-binding protein